VLAVRLGVVPARFGVMVFGVAGVAVGGVGMMGRLLVIAGLMVLRRFTMMLGRVLVVLGGLLMVLNALVLAHVSSRSGQLKVGINLRRPPDSLLTVSRQVCCGLEACEGRRGQCPRHGNVISQLIRLDRRLPKISRE
jgi:hypothetical protein